MKTRFLIVMLLAIILLTACGAAAPATSAPPMEEPALAMAPPVEQDSAKGGESNAVPGGVIYNTGAEVNTAAYDRMVIKNGEIDLLVKDSDVALDGITQLVGDMGGYIVSSQVHYEEYYGTNYKYATLTISVPADQFETALRRLRNLSIRVLNETASGQDVTDQYVDLQSQLTNLEATRDRIKSFLDQATTVDEALRINQQLSDVESQIEKIRGQMNYLDNRSAYSTITVSVKPDLPVIVSTPTPTPTPVVWDPGKTWEKSTRTLTSTYRGIADFLIWFFVVLVPILLPPVLIVWFIWWMIRRASRGKPKG
jgi:hypothetical protein